MEKCFRYWTDNLNETYTPLKGFSVRLKSKPIECEGYIVRELIFQCKGVAEDYELTQFHFINWPDLGVPGHLEPIIQMLSNVHEKMSADRNLNKNDKEQYLTIHCSAGCGRTGTIMALDQVWHMLNEHVSIIPLFLNFVTLIL